MDQSITGILLTGIGGVVTALVYVYTRREKEHETRYCKLEEGHAKCEEGREKLQETVNTLSVEVGELRGEARGISAGKTAIIAAQQSIEGLVSELRDQLLKSDDDA